MRRPGSPLFGFSILTTSAPSHAKASVQVGPASNWVRSTTRTPCRQLRGAKFPLILCISSLAGGILKTVGQDSADAGLPEVAVVREQTCAAVRRPGPAAAAN